MIEKLYGDLPSYGKSYFAEKFEEVYISMVKKSLDVTIDVVDEYIEFWSDDMVQEVELCKKANWDYETLCCLGEDESEQWLDGKMMKSSFEKRIRNDYFLAKNGGIL